MVRIGAPGEGPTSHVTTWNAQWTFKCADEVALLSFAACMDVQSADMRLGTRARVRTVIRPAGHRKLVDSAHPKPAAQPRNSVAP